MLLIESVISIAINAGNKILKIYHTDNFDERKKLDNSPLTKADLAAHNLIVQRLKEITPNIPILSEESANISWDIRKKWQRYWLIDPLDGTKEFIKHNGEFTVNIALIDNHEPVMGVVHAPALNITWTGEKDQPAKRIQAGEQQIIHTKQHQAGNSWRVVGSRTHAGDSLECFLDKLDKYELISMGSSIKLCMVAEGKADIYPRLSPASEWDTAAAHAVVNAAGGKVIIAKDNTPLLYNIKESIINPHFIVRAV